MTLDHGRVERFLAVADGQAPGGKVAAFGALARLGVPEEASDLVGSYVSHSMQMLIPGLARHDIARMARAVAPFDDIRIYRQLHDIAVKGSPGLREEVTFALGSVNDPNVISDLVRIPSRQPGSVACAYQVATYPVPALTEHGALLAQAASAACRFDTRLWLEVAAAKTGHADGLVELLNHLGKVGEKPTPEIRSLRGARWKVVERFRRAADDLPDEVVAKLRAYDDGGETTTASSIARLLIGGVEPSTPGISGRRDEAESAVRMITTRQKEGTPFTSQEVAELTRMVPAFEALSIEHGKLALEATMPMLALGAPEVRTLTSLAADAVASKAFATGSAREPVDAFLPLFSAYRANLVGGAVRTAAVATAGAPSASSADLAFDAVERFGGNEGQAAVVFDVIGDGAELFVPATGSDEVRNAADVGKVRVTVPATRTVHPRLEPEHVLGTPWPDSFTFVVGVQENQQAGLAEAEALKIAAIGVVELVVHLETTGVTVLDPERRRTRLVVTDSDRFPTETITLVRDDNATEMRVEATYYLDRQRLGMARWEVTAGQPPPTELSPSFTEPDSDIDLYLTVLTRGGNRIWWIGPTDTNSQGLNIVGAAVGESDAVLNALQDVFTNRLSEKTRRNRLLGLWRILQDAVPAEVWAAVDEATNRVVDKIRKPSVVLVTDDPQVPWEAATVSSSSDRLAFPESAENAGPAHLGGEAVIGRLPNAEGSQRPPADRAVEVVWILAPDYSKTVLGGGLTNVEEGNEVAARFANQEVVDLPHNLDGLVDYLVPLNEGEGGTPPDVLHIASHGTTLTDELGPPGLPLMANESLPGFKVPVINLAPTDVNHLDLGQRTFVFLNLCHGAAATSVLGQAVGLADAFASAGARAVVAPLWQVDDSQARAFAKALYEHAGHMSVAEAVSELRRQVPANDLWASWLAYRCFGHPHTHIISSELP